MRSVVLLAVAACACAAPAFVANSNFGYDVPLDAASFASMVSAWGADLSPADSFPDTRRKLIQAVLNFGESVLTDAAHTADVARAFAKHFPAGSSPSPAAVADKVRSLLHATSEAELTAADGLPTLTSDQYPYFGFIPPLQGAAVPGAAEDVTFATPCWKSVTISASAITDDGTTLSITADGQLEPGCKAHFLLGTVAKLQIGVEIGDAGTHTFAWNPTMTDAEKWDLTTKGIRVYRFTDGTIDTIIQIVETALLFAAEATKPVGSAAAARNVYFMKEYAHRDMLPRKTQVVTIDPATIQSGDFFGIIRLDGLDPMLGWAMGSTTGHTTVALRDEITNELFITESTVTDSYWPTNGIQKTPWDRWIQQAINASFQVVHAPLGKDAAAKFNLTAAWRWFNQTEGLDYGYHNMLWGWIDTVKDNYPCTPPDFESKCLEWSHVEVLFAVINKLVPSIGELLFMQAWNLRLGTVGLPPAELYRLADQKGMKSEDIPVIVEQDSWMYNTTRNGKPAIGPSSVCCVHVCRTWKAAGLFDSIGREINCAEQTNLDDYTLAFLDPHPIRPQACIDADPDNTLCQLAGEFTLSLNDYAMKPLSAHMGEKCPSLAPNYTRPAGC